MERKNMWEHYTEVQEKELEELALRYRKCLDQSKIERECVAVLSMHEPYEVTSKSDVYEVNRGYKAFLKNMK